MNYEDVENLAARAKLGDNEAKEKLVSNFNPLIWNISKKSFVNSYDFSDIKNECYMTLFKCVDVYNAEKHCFVGYATTAIKNTIYNLIKTSIRRNSSEGKSAFILDGGLDDFLTLDMIEDLEDLILSELDRVILKSAIGTLTSREQELVAYIFFEDYTLRDYSKLKGISYNIVVNRKRNVLEKLKKSLKLPPKDGYLN